MGPAGWAWFDGVGFHAIRALVSVFWQSTVLFVGVGILVHNLPRVRPSVKHALWAATLFLALVAPLASWGASSAGVPLKKLAVIPPYVPPGTIAVSAPDASHTTMPTAAGSSVVDEEKSPAATMLKATAARSFSVGDCRWALALLVYMAGLVFFVSLVLFGRIRIRRWRRRGDAVTDTRVIEAFRRARRRMGITRNMNIIESNDVPAPLTIGTFRPSVLLPKGMARTLSDADLDAVAMHESAHIRRYDSLVLTLASLARAVFYFHPGVWFAARQVSVFCEQAADDAVLDADGEPLPYAKMLARMAETLPRRAFSTEVAAGIVLAKSAFLCRVEAILCDRQDIRRKLSALARTGIVLAALLMFAVAAGLPLAEGARRALPAKVEASQTNVAVIGTAFLRALPELNASADTDARRSEPATDETPPSATIIPAIPDETDSGE